MLLENINKEQLDKNIEENKLVIVNYFASWCPPCKMFTPVFKEYSETNEELYIKMDIDTHQDAAMAVSVQSIPTTIIYRDAKEVDRQLGFLTKIQLDELINRYR